MSVPTSSLLLTVAIELVIVLAVVRRSLRMSQGVPYSGARLVILPVLLLVLWAVTELESVLLTPWAVPYLIAADAALVVVSSVLFAGTARRLASVYRGPAGVLSYRIGFSVTVVFLVIFLARLVLAAVLFPASLSFAAPSGYAAPDQQIVLAVIDAMFSVSIGLLLGRAIGVYRKVQDVGSPEPPAAPPA